MVGKDASLLADNGVRVHGCARRAVDVDTRDSPVGASCR